MTLLPNKSVTPQEDRTIRSVLQGEPSKSTAVLDVSIFGLVPDDVRYISIVRSPDSYIVLGRYGSAIVAWRKAEEFMDGMRRLLSPL